MPGRQWVKCTAFAVLLMLFCSLCVTACGKGASKTGVSGPASAGVSGKTEVGKVVKAGDWEIAVTGPAEKVKVVGQTEINITYQASGIYVVVPVKVANVGKEMAVVPRELLTVKDGQGREFQACHSTIQAAYILPRKMDLLLDSPLGQGATRETVALFDVPTNATGLRMCLQGTDTSVELGF